MKKFSIIDIETTGANRDGQRIIEIGIINFDGHEVEETFSTLINPEKPISYQIQRLTGIDNEMVAHAPKFFEVAKKIVEMTEGRIFVAHNVFFDYKFLQREFSDLGYAFKREVFCTCKSARRVFPGLPSYSLKNLSLHFNLERESAHRALSDAKDAFELFRQIQAKLSGQLDITPEDYLLPAQLKNFSFENFPETYGVYFMYGEDHSLLYVGKSKNVRQRLKQHFKNFKGTSREEKLKSEVVTVDYLETFHQLPTSLLELHFIKTLRPKYNRAQRARIFRYGLKLKESPFPEIKIVTTTSELETAYLFSTKTHAQKKLQNIYQKIFGLDLFDLQFQQKIQIFYHTLGHEIFFNKLKKIYDDMLFIFEDQKLTSLTNSQNPDWELQIKNNQIFNLKLSNHPTIKLTETPDMRSILQKEFPRLKRVSNEK